MQRQFPIYLLGLKHLKRLRMKRVLKTFKNRRVEEGILNRYKTVTKTVTKPLQKKKTIRRKNSSFGKVATIAYRTSIGNFPQNKGGLSVIIYWWKTVMPPGNPLTDNSALKAEALFF
eukprot:Platyproteum_vivax@DN13594_c0_g1_i1.p1